MSNGLVVGIFPGTDPSQISSALSGQQIDLSKVKVISKGNAQATELEDDESGIEFMDVGEAMEHNSFSDDMTKDKGIMGDSGGTSVPGIGGRGPSLGEFTHFPHLSYLGGWGIPFDEVDNFNGAIDEGRAVVAYPDAGTDADAVAAAFKAAGLKNVRSY